MDDFIISKGSLKQGILKDKSIVITGGCGGIGFEAAKSLIWLGSRVILIDIDRKRIYAAKEELKKLFPDKQYQILRLDISKERHIKKLYKFTSKKKINIDGIINNATIACTGSVVDVPIRKWDESYRVNLRGPILLTKYFLPQMMLNKDGIIVFVSSSGAAPYLGAYEIYKTAQVELGYTLTGELENTGVKAFTIGPGIVKTETAINAIHSISKLYGKTVDEFFEMNKNALISVEEAGAGFAAAVALADKYNGTETSSIQALIDVGIEIQDENENNIIEISEEIKSIAEPKILKIKATFDEQVNGWKERIVFERQWVFRDFKKTTGMTHEKFREELIKIEKLIGKGIIDDRIRLKSILDKLKGYYLHQIELLKGYERNKEKVNENTKIMNDWINDIEALINALKI